MNRRAARHLAEFIGLAVLTGAEFLAFWILNILGHALQAEEETVSLMGQQLGAILPHVADQDAAPAPTVQTAAYDSGPHSGIMIASSLVAAWVGVAALILLNRAIEWEDLVISLTSSAHSAVNVRLRNG